MRCAPLLIGGAFCGSYYRPMSARKWIDSIREEANEASDLCELASDSFLSNYAYSIVFQLSVSTLTGLISLLIT